MSANPTVDRYLSDKALDHIDHALGRPVWPLRPTMRNYFAICAGSDIAQTFDASEHWSLNGVQGEMAFYSVTDAGRRALVAHLAMLSRQHRAYEVTFEGYTTIIPAETAAKARYRQFLRISDAICDLTFPDFCRNTTVRIAR